MKKMSSLFFGLVFVLTSLVSTSNAQTWALDQAHAKLGFEVSHLVVSTVEGEFKSFDAKITSSKEDFSDAKVELSADVATISTNQEQRDNHLKSPDFFDVAKFEKLTFKSTSVKKKGNELIVKGNLTLHGVTKEVELTAKLGGTAIHPYNKKTVAAFKVSGIIKRSDFGLGGSTPVAVVGDEVVLDAKVEFIKE